MAQRLDAQAASAGVEVKGAPAAHLAGFQDVKDGGAHTLGGWPHAGVHGAFEAHPARIAAGNSQQIGIAWRHFITGNRAGV